MTQIRRHSATNNKIGIERGWGFNGSAKRGEKNQQQQAISACFCSKNAKNYKD